MKHLIFGLFMTVSVVAINAPVTLRAQEQVPQTQTPQKPQLEKLPDVETLDMNSFVSQSVEWKQAFEAHPNFSFTMQIPKEMSVIPQDQLINTEENGRISGEIFSAVGAAAEGMRPKISVQVASLDRLMSAKNWFINEVLKSGYTLKAIQSQDDNAFEAYYVRLDEYGRTEIVRTRGFLNQDQVVTVNYSIPVKLWQSDKDKQILTVKSFEFSNNYEVIPPEKMHQYSYNDAFRMEYPKSWLFTAYDVAKGNAFTLSLKTADRDGFLIAQMDIHVASGKSFRNPKDMTTYQVDLPGIIAAKRAMIDDMGYTPDKIMERHSIPLTFLADINVTEVYPLRKKASEDYTADSQSPVINELWMTVIRRPSQDSGKSYVITMIAPSRDNNMYHWIVATDAYKRVVQSIR